MRDPGLQPQRTALAWSRTALAMVVNSVLVLRIGIDVGDRSVEFLGLAFLAIAGGMLLIGESRRRELAGKEFGKPSPLLMAICAICVVLVSLASVVAMKR